MLLLAIRSQKIGLEPFQTPLSQKHIAKTLKSCSGSLKLGSCTDMLQSAVQFWFKLKLVPSLRGVSLFKYAGGNKYKYYKVGFSCKATLAVSIWTAKFNSEPQSKKVSSCWHGHICCAVLAKRVGCQIYVFDCEVSHFWVTKSLLFIQNVPNSNISKTLICRISIWLGWQIWCIWMTLTDGGKIFIGFAGDAPQKVLPFRRNQSWLFRLYRIDCWRVFASSKPL